MKEKTYYVYMLSNKRKNVLYTGITGNLEGRVREHKNKLVMGFTSKYNVDLLGITRNIMMFMMRLQGKSR